MMGNDREQSQQKKVVGKVTVLLVDDEEDFRILFIRKMKRFFKDYEFNIFEASDGKEALELLKKDVTPSIIILDYAMPNVDGIEFLRRIDVDNPELYNVPRIMITGYYQEQIKNEAERLKCAFFEKSTDIEKY